MNGQFVPSKPRFHNACDPVSIYPVSYTHLDVYKRQEPIFIEDVARLAMLSQSYFSYLFKAITHKTFVEYLNSLRIQKAMDLLKVTNDLVVDVCFESGFKNVNHFNRTFKSMVGVSPMQYRKSNRKKKEDVAENREDRQKTSAV